MNNDSWKILSVILLIPISVTLRGIAVALLWGWFLTPLGLPTISIPLAIGISLLVGYLTGNYKEDAEDIGEAVLDAILAPIFVIIVGFIISLFL